MEIKTTQYLNFIAKSKNKLILDVIYFSLNRKYTTFNRLRTGSNNRIPTNYIKTLKGCGVLTNYTPSKVDKKTELNRNGIGKYHLSKMKFYTLNNDTIDMFKNSYKLYRKLKQMCVNRFSKRRLKKQQKQQQKYEEEQQKEEFKSYRHNIFNNYDLHLITNNPNHIVEFFKNKIYTVGDFMNYDILTLKKLIGLKHKELNYIKLQLCKILKENCGFVNGNEY